MRGIFVLAALLLLSFSGRAQDERFGVDKSGKKPVYQFPVEVGVRHLEALKASYPTLGLWEARRAMLRANILRRTGLDPMPRKTDLTPIYGPTRKYKDYTVTNIALQTVPGYWLCGAIYRPTNAKGKTPVVLTPDGHFRTKRDVLDLTDRGHYRPDQQVRCAMLASMGVTVFSYDLFAYNAESPLQGMPIEDHQNPMAITMQIWNSIRALDYLCSLDYVDASKIGITGASGGSILSSFVGAVDDRVAFVVPVALTSACTYGSCPCQSGRDVHETPAGLNTNNAEIVAISAPRPQLLISDGADNSAHNPEIEYPYLQYIYRLYGKEENVGNVHIPNDKHDYGPNKRQALYDFVTRICGLDAGRFRSPDGRYDESGVTIENPSQLVLFDTAEKLPAGAVKSLGELKASWEKMTAGRAQDGRFGPDKSSEQPHKVLPEVGARHLEALRASYPTPELWEARRAMLRANILRRVGLDPMPRKTNLTPIYGPTRKYKDYTVTNVALQTVPGYWLCGAIYRPTKARGKTPAVLTPDGHCSDKANPLDLSKLGHYRDEQQVRCAMLASMGVTVFSYDLFAYNAESPLQGIPNEQHRTPFAMTLQLWNSIRALDFVASLPGVDASRIGMTGSSGGGTLTFMTGAVDDRLAFIVPVAMVSSWFYGGCPCESGLDVHQTPSGPNTCNPEIAAAFAPRPQRVISDGGDWTATTPEIEFPYLQYVYRLCGAEANVENVHLAQGKHNYDKAKREAMYDFVTRICGLDPGRFRSPDGRYNENLMTLEAPEKLIVFDRLPAGGIVGLDTLQEAFAKLR